VRVLVTGSGGFLGGHIARRLAEAGFEVVALTRGSPVAPPVTAAAARRFAVVTADLASGPLPVSMDAVVHAAATSAWTDTSVDRMLSDNVSAMQAIVRHARAAKVSAFVFLSSVSAFGTIRTPVLTESEPAIDVDSYGLTKLLGEKLLEDASNTLPSLSIRLPAVVGRGSKRNWPSECLRKLKAGDALEIFNPDAPFNNVVHERDVAGLVIQALQRGLSEAETVLAGSAGRTTIARAVHILREAAGSKSVVTAVKRDRSGFLLDVNKATRLFGFAPMHVETTLHEFVTDNA
jgi:nucleoside-diphosphate-sugar epimerase